jgi:hypothetical protein
MEYSKISRMLYMLLLLFTMAATILLDLSDDFLSSVA